jgi:myosin heavy subunit
MPNFMRPMGPMGPTQVGFIDLPQCYSPFSPHYPAPHPVLRGEVGETHHFRGVGPNRNVIHTSMGFGRSKYGEPHHFGSNIPQANAMNASKDKEVESPGQPVASMGYPMGAPLMHVGPKSSMDKDVKSFSAQDGKIESLKKIIVSKEKEIKYLETKKSIDCSVRTFDLLASKDKKIKELKDQKSTILVSMDHQANTHIGQIESLKETTKEIIESKDKQIKDLKADKSNVQAELEAKDKQIKELEASQSNVLAKLQSKNKQIKTLKAQKSTALVSKTYQTKAQIESLKQEANQFLAKLESDIMDMEAQKSTFLVSKDYQTEAQNGEIESLKQIILLKDKQIQDLEASKSNVLVESEPFQAVEAQIEDEDYDFVDQAEIQQLEVVPAPLAGPGAKDVQGASEDVTLFANDLFMPESSAPAQKAATSVPAPAKAHAKQQRRARKLTIKPKALQSNIPAAESADTHASDATSASKPFKGIGLNKYAS